MKYLYKDYSKKYYNFIYKSFLVINHYLYELEIFSNILMSLKVLIWRFNLIFLTTGY